MVPGLVMCPLAIHQITTRGVPIVFAFAFAPLVGCSKPAVQFDQNWSPPVKVSESIDGFVGGVDLYRWQNTIMALQGLDDGSAKCFMFNRSGGNDAWAEVPLTGVPRGYIWARPAMDQASDKTFFQDGYMENDELVMKVLIGRLTGSLAVRDVKEEKWLTDRKTLFGDARPNERLNKPGKRNWPSLGLGLVNGEDLYIPYRINGETFNENTVFLSKGPFNNGAFHSTDSGMTWQLEQISDFAAWLPSMCKTKLYYYYFAVKNYQRDLWFSRKPVGGSSWEGPKVVTDTFCDSALHWQYVAAASGDTVHLCWLDRRHEKRRADPVDANRENYEVMYCQRKDADADWGKDIILSKGLLYSYRPCMSV